MSCPVPSFKVTGNQIVWQAPVALFIEPTAKIVELEDDDLPPLVDAPPLSLPPPPSQFQIYSPPSDSQSSSQSTFSFVSDEEASGAARKRSPSHSKKKPENHIPRPPNAFILFRSSFIKAQHVSQSIETNHSTLSKIIGLTWKNLSDSERKEWHDKAKKEQEAHRRKFPKYAFRPQQTKSKGSGTARSGGGGTGKRKVREVEPKDEKRCAKIAELLVQGLKGEELNAKMEEFDRTHVPEIVTRFEAPITEKTFQRGTSAPIEETELKIEQASFLPTEKTVKKVRRSVSERPTRVSTPRTATPQPTKQDSQPAFVSTTLLSPSYRLKLTFLLSQDFTTFSFGSTSMPAPFPTAVDPSTPSFDSTTPFHQDLTLDTSFLNMPEWASACSSPITPASSPEFLSTPSPPPTMPGFDLSAPSTPNFDAQVPMNMGAQVVFNGQKNFDFNTFSIPPTYQQNIDGFATDSFIGMDTGFGSLDMGVNGQMFDINAYSNFDAAIPQFAF